MTTQVNLLTSQDDFDELARAVDTTRRQQVRVDRSKLDRLLIDYGKIVNALRGSTTFKVTTPPNSHPRRKKARLLV